MLNKKAFYDDVLPLLILLMVLMFFFISCTPLQKKSRQVIQNDVSGAMDKINADQLLLNYLTEKVEVSDKQVTSTDLIINSYLKEDFEEWEKLTKTYLEKYQPNSDSGWNIILYKLPSEEKIASALTYEMIIGGVTKSDTFTIIPTQNNQIKVRLYKKCQSSC